MAQLEFLDPYAPKGSAKVVAPAGANGPESHANGVPKGSTKEVIKWVGDDLEKAALALEAEKNDKKPRKGLIEELNDVLAASSVGSDNDSNESPTPVIEAAPASPTPAPAAEPVAPAPSAESEQSA